MTDANERVTHACGDGCRVRPLPFRERVRWAVDGVVRWVLWVGLAFAGALGYRPPPEGE
jgi:hypothetical protein